MIAVGAGRRRVPDPGNSPRAASSPRRLTNRLHLIPLRIQHKTRHSNAGYTSAESPVRHHSCHHSSIPTNKPYQPSSDSAPETPRQRRYHPTPGPPFAGATRLKRASVVLQCTLVSSDFSSRKPSRSKRISEAARAGDIIGADQDAIDHDKASQRSSSKTMRSRIDSGE